MSLGLRSVCFALSLYFASSQQFTTTPVNKTVTEGQNATFLCSVIENGVPISVGWRLNMLFITKNVPLEGTEGVFLGTRGSPLVLTSVSRVLDGLGIVCEANNPLLPGDTSNRVILTVNYPPKYTVRSDQSSTVMVGHMFSYEFTLSSKPSIRSEDFNWTSDGQIISSGNRIVTTANKITISNVSRSDSGLYQVSSQNMAGRGMANFTLDVQFPPQLSVNNSPLVLLVNSTFTMNCTAVMSNPRARAVVFSLNSSHIDKDEQFMSIDNFVLTISHIQRKHRGTYTCNVSNEANLTTVATVVVNVFGPPSVPRELSVTDLGPFSATVQWSAPEDDGGAGPTQYIGVVSNGTGTMLPINTTGVTMVPLTHLQHSTTYTVSVVARNVHGSSPALLTMFRTNDTVPIIDKIAATALSLANITVNISLHTAGGQNVTSFTISINNNNITIEPPRSNTDTITSLVVDGLILTKGTDYSVSVTATNSIGESEPVMGTLTVPNPPNITANFSEITISDKTTCCSGVKLNLARPQDVSVSDVRVSLSANGGPYEMVRSGDLTLSGDILYISGLQAGSVYMANITVSNIFGSTEQQTTLKPVLGQPSRPAVPTVTIDGTVVTVVLSTAYPGTEGTRRDNNFRFELQFTKGGISTRQSSTQTVPFTPSGLNTTINTTRDFSLSAGTYTVSVSAVNEHGPSEMSSPSKQFVIEEPTTSPPTPNDLPVIIGAVVGGAVLVLLILIVIFICIICYMKFWRTRGHYKTESGKPVPLTNNGANGDDKEDIEMMENQTALYDEVDRAGAAAKKKKEAEAMGVVNQYDDPDVQQQPEMYAEVDHSAKTSNKKKKKKEEKQQETAPHPEVYAEVDKSAKTSKKDDEPKPPPHTEGLVYAQIDFANKSSTYKKPEPKNDDVVIYSEVTVQHQPRKQDDDKEQDGNHDRDDRGGSPNAII